MGRKSSYQKMQEQLMLTQHHYLQYDSLRAYVDISRDVLDDMVACGHVTRYKPQDYAMYFYCLEEVLAYITANPVRSRLCS